MRYGHIQEVIVQNFRVKPEIPMRDWPEPTRGEMLRTVAVARLLMPEVNLQAPPNLSTPYYSDLLDAGINDAGRVSPLTPDSSIRKNPGLIWTSSRPGLNQEDAVCGSGCRFILSS